MISKGNHVKFARFVLLAISEEENKGLQFFCVQCIVKQLLDSVLVISRIIKVLVRVITKTSSNNCLNNVLLDETDSRKEFAELSTI